MYTTAVVWTPDCSKQTSRAKRSGSRLLLQHKKIDRLCSTLHIQTTPTTLPITWGFQPGFVPQKPIWSFGGRHACVAISPASHEPRPRSVWPWSLPSGPENPSRSRRKTPLYPFLWPCCKRYLKIRKHRNFELKRMIQQWRYVCVCRRGSQP